MNQRNKKEWRQRIAARSAALSPEYRKAADAAITAWVLESEDFRRSHTVFIYVSTAREPDTAGILAAAWQQGKRVLVPKCYTKHDMYAIEIHSREDLEPGMLGIPEPKDFSQPVPPEEIDLMIVPCVSAGRDGARLGHGAGYYDRFLAQASCRTICLCYEALTEEKLPMEAHDRRMDRLVTEAGCFPAQEPQI